MSTKAKSFHRRRIAVPDGVIGLDAVTTVACIGKHEIALCAVDVEGVRVAWKHIFGSTSELDESRIQRVTLCDRDFALTLPSNDGGVK